MVENVSCKRSNLHTRHLVAPLLADVARVHLLVDSQAILVLSLAPQTRRIRRVSALAPALDLVTALLQPLVPRVR